MPRTPTNSQIYRFEREPLKEDVYKSTTSAAKDVSCFASKKASLKKSSVCCFTFLFSMMFMGSFTYLYSLTYVADHEIAYYDNIESYNIMYPGFHLNFRWNPHKLKFVSIVDALLIPMLDDSDNFFQNITVDYKIMNITEFVKSSLHNDKICLIEIIKNVQDGIKNTTCSDIIIYDQIYEVTTFINTTIDLCGITITNLTFPKAGTTTQCKNENIYRPQQDFVELNINFSIPNDTDNITYSGDSTVPTLL
jgi:hypothetical protein